MLKFIYHTNCWDGFCAAWIASKAWPEAELIPANYKSEPPDVTGHDVIIADFSYDRDVLIDMKNKAKSLIGFDHHETAKNKLDGLDFYTFDMSKSGARMIWDYCKQQKLITLNQFFKHKRQPGCYPNFDTYIHWMVAYTEDRDLWLKKLQHTDEVNAALRSYPFDLAVWDELAHLTPDDMAAEGRPILRVQQKVIDHHLRHLQWVEIDGIRGKGCCCTVGSIWSDVMEQILHKGDVKLAVVWCDNDKGERIYSIRSTQDGPNVEQIAVKRDGGGHKRAASFTLKCTALIVGDAPTHIKIEKSAPTPTEGEKT